MKGVKLLTVLVLLILASGASTQDWNPAEARVDTPKETETTVMTETVEIKLPNGQITTGKKKTTFYTTKWNTTYTYTSPVVATIVTGQETTKQYAGIAGTTLPVTASSAGLSPLQPTHLPEAGSGGLFSQGFTQSNPNIFWKPRPDHSGSYGTAVLLKNPSSNTHINTGEPQVQSQGPNFSPTGEESHLQHSYQNVIYQKVENKYDPLGHGTPDVYHQPALWQQPEVQEQVKENVKHYVTETSGTTAKPELATLPTIDPIYIRSGLNRGNESGSPYSYRFPENTKLPYSSTKWSANSPAAVPLEDSIKLQTETASREKWKQQQFVPEIDWRSQTEVSSKPVDKLQQYYYIPATGVSQKSQQPTDAQRPQGSHPSNKQEYIPLHPTLQSEPNEGHQQLYAPQKQVYQVSDAPPAYLAHKVVTAKPSTSNDGILNVPPASYATPTSAIQFAHLGSYSSKGAGALKNQEDNFDEFSEYDDEDEKEIVLPTPAIPSRPHRPVSSIHAAKPKRPNPSGRPKSGVELSENGNHPSYMQKTKPGSQDSHQPDQGSVQYDKDDQWRNPNHPRPQEYHRPQLLDSDVDYDTSEYYPKQRYKCPALDTSSPGLQIECMTRNYDVTACSEPQPVGTVATYTCKRYFESSSGRASMVRKCKDDGTWTGSRDRFNCILECGKGNLMKSPLITNGSPTVKGQWPWNVATFYQTRVSSTERGWTFICGGTLITESAVLTAAHCVTHGESTEVRNERLFRLEFGKYKRTEADEYVQSRYVSKIIVHDSYSPYGFDSDIAILILEKPIDIGYHVRPICYPQSSDSDLEEIHLSEHSLGTVVGWGKTESGELADTLNIVRLPVVSRRDCLENFQDALTTQLQTRSTTYCAGFKNGSNVCSGDSGAGMYFPANTISSVRWYIQGIVSVGIPDKERRCDPTKYSVFTRVGRYAEWISKVLSQEESS